MRGCWNRQTGTFEVRVSYGVGVQVPSLAPKMSDRHLPIAHFLCSVGGRRTRKDRNAVFSQGFALSQTYDWHKLGAKPVQSPLAEKPVAFLLKMCYSQYVKPT